MISFVALFVEGMSEYIVILQKAQCQTQNCQLYKNSKKYDVGEVLNYTQSGVTDEFTNCLVLYSTSFSTLGISFEDCVCSGV